MATPSAAQLIAASEKMIPSLVERAPADEANGMVCRATVDEIVQHGLLRVCQPKRYQGWEMPFSTLAQIVVNLARGDHSVGWIYGLFALHSHHLAMFDDRAQRDVWEADPDAIIASSYSPYGKAISGAQGGYRLSGSWPYSSGCDHGDWFFVGGLVDGDQAKFRTFLVPKEYVSIVDDWHVFGLKATGSKTIVVKDAFVPDYRSVPFGPDTEDFEFPGFAVNTEPRYRAPYLVVFNRGVTAVSIGSLQAMIDAFVDYNRRKVSMITGKAVAELPDALEAAGEAVALIDQLKILAIHDLEALERYAAERNRFSPATVNLFRYRAQVAGQQCLKAAQALYELVGGGGLYETLPISRIYRNLISAGNHPATAVWRATLRQVGSDAFGAPTTRPTRF